MVVFPTILNLSLLEMASPYIPSTSLDFVKIFFSICPKKSLAPNDHWWDHGSGMAFLKLLLSHTPWTSSSFSLKTIAIDIWAYIDISLGVVLLLIFLCLDDSSLLWLDRLWEKWIELYLANQVESLVVMNDKAYRQHSQLRKVALKKRHKNQNPIMATKNNSNNIS